MLCLWFLVGLECFDFVWFCVFVGKHLEMLLLFAFCFFLLFL